MSKIFSIFILSLFIVNFLLGFVVADGETVDKTSTYTNAFFEGEVTNTIIKSISNALGIGATWKEVIIGFIILLILFAGMYDILELVAIFQSRWVKMIIAGGLAVVGALSGLVNAISLGLTSIAAGAGAFAIFLEIIISIGVFIGLSIASPKIQEWAAKRAAATSIVKGIKGSGDIQASLNTLREISGPITKGK